jgi:uncharacterized protein DUF4167
MNEGRNATKPQRRWSHTSLPNQRNNPRPAGSRRHGQISANAEKSYHSYLALAREADSTGDTIAAENFYQHAEHFLRLLKEPTR